MIKFVCKGFYGSSRKTWHGYISKLVYMGSHLEISIVLSQPITACVCKTLSGFFVYFAHYECGVNLGSLFDIDGNYGRLAAIFDDKDAFTVAYAISKVGDLLSSPRNKRITACYREEDLPF